MDLARGERIPLFPISQNAAFSEDEGTAPEARLPPLMVSVGEEDFLVTTGTTLKDPALGLFVNLEGDAVRGNLVFSTYPRAISILMVSFSANISHQQSAFVCLDAGFQCRDSFG